MKRGLTESVNNAVDGIIYAFRTENNLKIHFAISLMVLVFCLLVDLEPSQLLCVFFLIALVIVSEMFNTALEALVNLQTLSHHPLAKIAKDVAAGGVFVACLTSLVGAYLLFWEPTKKLLWGPRAKVLYQRIAEHYTHGVIVLLTIILVAVMIGKAMGQKGSFTRGGLVSGHAAVAFGASTAILVITRNPIATVLAFAMALLVAQSRVEANIHRWIEVVTGALLGTVASLVVFLIFYSFNRP
jgi:diacylglycerol kinase (ATP)